MKIILLILSTLLISLNSYSQIWTHHIISSDKIYSKGFEIKNFGIDGRKEGKNVVFCKKLLGIISLSSGNLNIDLWEVPKCLKNISNAITDTTKLTVLRIVDTRPNYGTPSNVLWIPYQSVNIGLNTLPYRYRFSVNKNSQKFDGVGTSNFNLALNVGYTFGWSAITSRVINNYSLTLGIYGGPSTFDLKKNQYIDQTKYVSDQTNPTLTYGFNIIAARNGLGLVLAYGWEEMHSKNAGDWIYNGGAYFAFGVNTRFGK